MGDEATACTTGLRDGATAGPDVSVIIPTYNRAVLLRDAIESVLAQSCRSYEIIVVDDGSTDDTAAVAAGYGDRIRYVHTENGGVAHGRNVGMQHARGRYLTFLDSDDRLYPYALELQVALLDRLPDVGMVCAELSGFDDRGFFERYHLRRYHRSAFRDPAETYDDVYEQSHPITDLVPLPLGLAASDPQAAGRRVYVGQVFDTYLRRLIICQNSVVMRREVAQAAGLRNVRVHHWQEVDYLLRITRHHRIAFVDVPTYQLRYHEGQISVGRHQVWLRKQRILLRVVRRHAEADAAYYAAHRAAIDAHLAHLHRAVAAPLLLAEGAAAHRRRQARRARVYLARAARLGHPAPMLWLAAWVPYPVGRLVAWAAESARELRRAVRARLQPRGRA